jgi:hypothetical protein
MGVLYKNRTDRFWSKIKCTPPRRGAPPAPPRSHHPPPPPPPIARDLWYLMCPARSAEEFFGCFCGLQLVLCWCVSSCKVDVRLWSLCHGVRRFGLMCVSLDDWGFISMRLYFLVFDVTWCWCDGLEVWIGKSNEKYHHTNTGQDFAIFVSKLHRNHQRHRNDTNCTETAQTAQKLHRLHRNYTNCTKTPQTAQKLYKLHTNCTNCTETIQTTQKPHKP